MGLVQFYIQISSRWHIVTVTYLQNEFAVYTENTYFVIDEIFIVSGFSSRKNNFKFFKYSYTFSVRPKIFVLGNHVKALV